ncbi:DegT/DnrJ/EryC1/StrS family aminotransferase [Granulicella cerasi]|uniref:DegT/DnrJ/EryC1/StrS family aminotransferase n=1 Tax=Granulicella cerasi TaxID=741063 RepID=A0ABW1Z775_9BACT|nr:DegT/DnrJ/EryC1/StrS family aminotransferase [Granulicella cerasi]
MSDSALSPVPLLDFSREYQAHREELLAALIEVADTQRFILGPAVQQFEASAAASLEVEHAVGCASGTDALWLALAALEVGGEEGVAERGQQAVVTTPFSFFATVSSILRAGGVPVLADIDPLTFNLSATATAEAIERHHTASGAQVAAIMPVHLYGQCADMDAFTTLATQHGAVIVEDAAQAFGAKWNGVQAGSLGDAAAFSFYPTKNLAAMGDAGMVTTHDAATAERATMLRAHGMRKRYFHDEVGWNSRIDSLQAAALSVRLRYVEAGNARRREIAALYAEAFTAAGLVSDSVTTGIVLPYTDPRAEHVFHQYVIRAPRRDDLRAHLASLQIGSEVYYPLPLHLQESLASLGYKRGDFPHSEKAAEEVLALPIYPELRDDEVATVVEGIRRFYA